MDNFSDMNQGLHDYYGETTLHPLGLAMVVICGLLLLTMPRRYAVWPMLAMACFVSPAQRVVIASLNFDLLRVMVIFGWMRLILRGETASLRWKPLDTAVLVYGCATVVLYTLNMGELDALKNQLGYSFDAIGMYFYFRCTIRTWADIDSIGRASILLSIPVAIFFIVEKLTGHNAFAFLGGVPELTIEREGQLRCQGAFAHPILAGCFWTALMPLIAARWWKGERFPVYVGLASCAVIIVTCSSSTPLTAAGLSVLAALCFWIRDRLRLVRWGIVVALVGLHLVMARPVWHLLARMDFTGGSTGWHRYQVIDQAIAHLSEWWLVGTRSIVGWQVWAGDTTNQYVVEGIRGGLLQVALFMWIIVLGFAAIGRTWRRVQTQAYPLALAWGMGVCLFVHCMNFIGVSYFGQISLIWYMLLAMIGSLGVLPVGAISEFVSIRQAVSAPLVPIRTAVANRRGAPNRAK